MTAVTDGRETAATPDPQPHLSGDDGDVGAELLGIGYPEAELELAEAAEELAVVEDGDPDELDELDPAPAARIAPRRLGELAALVALGALAGATIASVATR